MTYNKPNQELQEVRIDKLVHGGQGLGVLADGRKVFVWNALPNELVMVRLLRSRRDYAEAVAEQILQASPVRQQPRDDAYLSTSPWQIMTDKAEIIAKQQILTESLSRSGIKLTDDIQVITTGPTWHYRNKMEYSFWADDSGLRLALFNRGSRGKRAIQGSSIARPEIDKTAQKMCSALEAAGIRGSQLKTGLIRCDQAGNVVVALFVKDQNFPDIDSLKGLCQGIQVCYSTPKSPASVLTKVLYTDGDISLQDEVLGNKINYNVHSFFQVNLPIFELAVGEIKHYIAQQKKATQSNMPIIDLYSGVGTIGLCVGATTLVESSLENVLVAKNSAPKATTVVHASSEQALEHISPDCLVIVDPPRAGLHSKLINHLLDVRPLRVVYLSCNPSTQARDLSLLQKSYEVKRLQGYNFFPKTPHIESLAMLELIA